MDDILEAIEMVGLVNWILCVVAAITWVSCYVVARTLYDIHKSSFLPTMTEEEYLKLMREKGFHFTLEED